MTKAHLAATIAAIAVLLAFSAFFSATETAISLISKPRSRALRKSRAKKDSRLSRILIEKPRMITTILIGNNLVNVWSSSIATALAMEIWGTEGLAIATAGMTVLIIFLSEISPKTLAASAPESVARVTAPLLGAIAWILTLPASLFTGINRFFIHALDHLASDTTHRLTEDEIRTMMELGKRDGALEEPEHALLSRAFGFS